MNALVLAAGLGTRLRPITDTIPKALVNVGGETLLERILLRLKANGFDHIVVNVHHFAQQIIDFLNFHDRFGLDIQISDEQKLLLDTGGAIKRAMSLFHDNSPVLVHNVDILNDVPLHDFFVSNSLKADATLLVSQRATSRYLVFDKESYALKGWTNLKTGEVKGDVQKAQLKDNPQLLLRAFSGIHIFSPRLLHLMETEWPERFSIIDFYLQACRSHTIIGKEMEATHLLDVGKLESLDEANDFIHLHLSM